MPYGEGRRPGRDGGASGRDRGIAQEARADQEAAQRTTADFIAIIPKNKREDIRISLSKFNEIDLLNVRIFVDYSDDGRRPWTEQKGDLGPNCSASSTSRRPSQSRGGGAQAWSDRRCRMRRPYRNSVPAPALQSLARALGGNISGSSVLCPGPGHSAKDRSLSVTPSLASPTGFIVHSHAGDDWRNCRDHVASLLGMRGIRSAPLRSQPATSNRSPSSSPSSVRSTCGDRASILAGRWWNDI